MVGILLALQVSNWNQQRIAEQKEELLLEALNDEFIDNKSQLERVIAIHERALASTEYAISQFPINLETFDQATFSEGSKHWGNWNTFNLSQGVIRSLVSTSSFELISDLELRVLLVSWDDVLADYKEEEDFGVNKDETAFLHTENFVLVDQNRHIRGIYNGLNKSSINQLIEDIRTLKKEG